MTSDTEEEDEVCCRICRNTSTSDHVLYTPCKCSGSIRYVHEDCLISWLNLSKRQTCELCGHKFEFRPVYADNAPQNLPLWQLAWVLTKQSWKALKLGFRVVFLIMIWLVSLPILTCWGWRMSFYSPRSVIPFEEGANAAVEGIKRRLYPFSLLADVVQGLFIGLTILFLMVFVSYIADHTAQYWQLLQPMVDEQEPQNAAGQNHQPEPVAQPPAAVPRAVPPAVPLPAPGRPVPVAPENPPGSSQATNRPQKLDLGQVNRYIADKWASICKESHTQYLEECTARHGSMDSMDRGDGLTDIESLQLPGDATWIFYLFMQKTGHRALDAKRLACVRADIFARQGLQGILENYRRVDGTIQWRISLLAAFPFMLPHKVLEWQTAEEFDSRTSSLSKELGRELRSVKALFDSRDTDEIRLVMGFAIEGELPNDHIPWPTQDASSSQLETADNLFSHAVGSSEDSGSDHTLGPLDSSDPASSQCSSSSWVMPDEAPSSSSNPPGPSSLEPPVSGEPPSSSSDASNTAGPSGVLEGDQLEPPQDSLFLHFPRLMTVAEPDEAYLLVHALVIRRIAKAWNAHFKDFNSEQRPENYDPDSYPVYPQHLLTEKEEWQTRLALVMEEAEKIQHQLESLLASEEPWQAARPVVNPQPPPGVAAEPAREIIPAQPPPAGAANPPIPPPPPPPAPPAQDRPRAAVGHGGRADDLNIARIIGLEGPLTGTIITACILLVACWGVLAGTLWIPFVIGKLTQFVFTADQLPWLSVSADKIGAAVLASVGLVQLNNTSAAPGLDLPEGLQNGSSPLGAEGPADSASLLRRAIMELETDLVGIGLDDWICLGLGYGVLLVAGATLLSSYVIWKLCTDQQTRERLKTQGGLLIAAYAQLTRQTIAQASYVALMTKVMLVLFLELALLPAFYGCWVDFCVLPLFGSSWGDRMLWLKVSPISFSLLHWALGMATLVTTATLLSLLRKEIRPGALPFFKDPFDREDEPFRDMVFLGFGQQIERQAFALAIFAALAVIALHIPLKVAKLPVFGVVPLHTSFSVSSSELEGLPFPQSIALIMYHFVVPWTIARMNFRLVIVRCLRTWLRHACEFFDLSDLLLQQDNENPPAIIPHGRFNDLNEEQRVEWRREVEAAKSHAPKLLMLLSTFLASFVFFNTALLVLPTLTGRWILKSVSSSTPHDLICFSVGGYALWGSAVAAYQLYKTLVLEPSTMTTVALSWLKKGVKLVVFAILGLGVLPLLVGLLFEHILLPIRMYKDSTPAFFLYSDWASGMIFLRTIYTHVLRPQNLNPNLQTRLGRRLFRVRVAVRVAAEVGVTNISLRLGVVRILWPCIQTVGVLLAVPFVITKGVMPRLPWVSLAFLKAAYIHAWWGEVFFLITAFLSFKLGERIEKYRASLRDRLYLQRRELISLPASEETASEGHLSSTA